MVLHAWPVPDASHQQLTWGGKYPILLFQNSKGTQVHHIVAPEKISHWYHLANLLFRLIWSGTFSICFEVLINAFSVLQITLRCLSRTSPAGTKGTWIWEPWMMLSQTTTFMCFWLGTLSRPFPLCSSWCRTWSHCPLVGIWVTCWGLDPSLCFGNSFWLFHSPHLSAKVQKTK